MSKCICETGKRTQTGYGTYLRIVRISNRAYLGVIGMGIANEQLAGPVAFCPLCGKKVDA